MKIFFQLTFAYILVMITVIKVTGQPIQTPAVQSLFKNMVAIPIGGNSWAINPANKYSAMITSSGIEGWDNQSVQINTFFRSGKTGTVQLAIRARVKSGISKIRCQLGQTTREISVANCTYDTLNLGDFIIEHAGYQKLTFTGIEKTKEDFGDISDLLMKGQAIDSQVRFVKDEFYWGRRGPSVHLNYQVPAGTGDIEWFYNEITVPAGNDVQGSYFMANGFGEGYFGIQVNSPSERRILFSVWSPFKTDKPGDIPDDQKILLLKKGKDVISGAFGNEGSGGQSYRKYYWKPETTYRFLLKAIPSENNSTDYTAWFFAPEINQWELIASFRRPKTTTSLKRLHSFLENFIPEKGNITRKGIYSNQWICNTSGQWSPLTEARFTADATARKEARLDYAGGVEKGGFFLENCGFFNKMVEINTMFARPNTSTAPQINLSVLP